MRARCEQHGGKSTSGLYPALRGLLCVYVEQIPVDNMPPFSMFVQAVYVPLHLPA